MAGKKNTHNFQFSIREGQLQMLNRLLSYEYEELYTLCFLIFFFFFVAGGHVHTSSAAGKKKKYQGEFKVKLSFSVEHQLTD